MARANPSPGRELLRQWARLSHLPFGKRLFSWAVGRTAPYTGTIGGVFTDVRPGYARVELRDRRAVRNHLASVHAVALVNLAEMTSGVALMTALPAGVRGIVTSLSIEYVKKARGTLVAETHATPPAAITETLTHAVVARITDAHGDVVATCTVHWRLSPATAEPRDYASNGDASTAADAATAAVLAAAAAAAKAG
jgi:acyl-coenzyme A thioesterase PaaI-like protein